MLSAPSSKQNHRAKVKCGKCRFDKVICESDDGKPVREAFKPDSGTRWEGCKRCKRISLHKKDLSIIQECRPYTLYIELSNETSDNSALGLVDPNETFSGENILAESIISSRIRRTSLPQRSNYPKTDHTASSKSRSMSTYSSSRNTSIGCSNPLASDAPGETRGSSELKISRDQIPEETCRANRPTYHQVQRRRASHSLYFDATESSGRTSLTPHWASAKEAEQFTNRRDIFFHTSTGPRRRRCTNDREALRVKSKENEAIFQGRRPRSTTVNPRPSRQELFTEDKEILALCDNRVELHSSEQPQTGIPGILLPSYNQRTSDFIQYDSLDLSNFLQTTHGLGSLYPDFQASNGDHNSNLQLAIINGDFDLVKAIVANLNEVSDFAHLNQNCFSAIMLAAEFKQANTVQLLLEADPRQLDDLTYGVELTLALHCALTNKDTKIVQMLLRYGANATAQELPFALTPYERVLDPPENHTVEMKELFSHYNLTGFDIGLGVGERFVA